MRYSISESCPCGAKLQYTEYVEQSYHRQVDNEHSRFLKAHAVCRQPVVISSNKELKLFLTNTKVRTDD